MRYKLGLDLGVGSIGSAIVELDSEETPSRLVDVGVRIFNVSEGAEERRQKRTARKNLKRRRKRLELLASLLCSNGLWLLNDPKGTRKLRAISPYELRKKALYEELDNPAYIGRVVLHLAKHRGAGFVSASEEFKDEDIDEEGDSKRKKKISPYDIMIKHIVDTQSQTVGEFFYKKIKENEGNQKTVRQKKFAVERSIVDYAIPRYLVKDEFNKIWDIQAKYFAQMNVAGLKQKVYEILFYERPPAPYATADCIYIKGEKRLPKAHPLFEKRRIYEEVNNIRIITDVGRRALTLAERNVIIDDLLMKGENAGKRAIKKVLGLDGQHQVLLQDDRIIKAYIYSKPEFDIPALKKLSEEEFSDFIEFLAEPLNPKDPQGRLYSEDALIAVLKERLNVQDEKQIGLILTKLPKGRGMLGKTATNMLLAKMQEKVITFREASDEIAKTDARFQAEEEIARQLQGKCSELPYYGKILQTDVQPIHPWVKERSLTLNDDEKIYGKIANPAVHMILNQIRLVVNEIVKIYGKPYAINIELGRDVGMSSKHKDQFEKNQKRNEKINEQAKEYLKSRNLRVTPTNILKYKLAEEQCWVDAYNPINKISETFFGMEVEHIIPQAKGGTNTYNNLCLVNRNDNLSKGDRYPFEFFDETKTEEELASILKNARERLKNKAWRFEADARERFEEEGDTEESNRYLTDTRYVSKMAQRYLRCIIDCQDESEARENRILAVRGQQTSILRQEWYLDGLEYELMGLDIPRYIECTPYWLEMETGEVIDGTAKPDIDGNWRFYDKKKNPEWMKKPRIDHRHHAMDAIAIACATRSLIQKMSKSNNLHKIDYPMPLLSVKTTTDFRNAVLDILKRVKVSHKSEHSKNGELHKSTGRMILCENPEDSKYKITVYSRDVLRVLKKYSDLNKLLLPSTVKDEWHKSIARDRLLQQKLFDDFNGYIPNAEQMLIAENEQLVSDGKKTIEITESRVLTKAFKLIEKNGLWSGGKFKNYENSASLIIIPRHGVAYEAQNNHCVDFYQMDGKVGWEVIKRFDINQLDFEPDWKKSGAKIIWSVQQGDLVELNTPETWKKYTDSNRCIARVKKFSVGKMTLDFSMDARMTSPPNKTLKYMLVDSLEDKGLSFFTKAKIRKVELTPFGKVKKKHKVLWDGKKSSS